MPVIHLRHSFAVVALLGFTLTAAGCGSEEGGEASPPLVVLNAATGPLQPGESFQFNASIDGVPGATAQWGILEGGVAGTISTNGLFTAGTTAGTYHVIAQSLTEPVGADTAEVTVIMTLTIDGATTPMGPGMQRQFTATVVGAAPTVNWSLPAGASAGTISVAGLYTAGQAGTHLIVATTATDPAVADTVEVVVIPDPDPPTFEALPDSVDPFAANPTFAVVPVAGLTYSWGTFGATNLGDSTGTSITVDIQENHDEMILRVTAQNAVGRTAEHRDTIPIIDRTTTLGGAYYGVATSSANVVAATQWLGGTVELFDATTGADLHHVAFPGVPVHLAFSPGGHALFVVNQTAQTLGRIDVATGTLDTLGYGRELYNLAVAPTGEALFVSSGDGWLFKADTGTLAKTDSVQLAGASNGLSYRGGQFWVGTLNGRLYRIDPGTLDLLDSIVVQDAQFQRIVLSADGSVLFAADQGNGRVERVVTATLARTGVSVGGATPGGIALSPDGADLWVGISDGTIQDRDPATLTFRRSHIVGGFVRNIAFDGNDTIFAANESDLVVIRR